uniref:Death domain containing 1 n=1 Tax=Electrophorus electricus TaxID=8005 RepID=A0A4W4GWR8_ELEEL
APRDKLVHPLAPCQDLCAPQQSGGQYPSNITPSENQEPSVLQSAPNTTADGCASREGQPSPHSPEGMCNESVKLLFCPSLPDPSSTSSSAPLHLAKLVTCKVADGLGSLTVSGSEELASVLGIEISSSTTHPFPLTVALPFRLCRHSRYREATVKVVDREQQVSYVTPAATEGIYGVHRGSFVVVRVHTLGVFAVVFRLQKEILTIPKRGLSLGLRMDPTIGLDYLRGSFTTSVVAQVKPVATTLLSTLKCRNESYLSINTSPLPYLSHPSTLNPRQPLTLPLPPNPEEGRRGGCPPDAHHPLAPSGQSPGFLCNITVVYFSIFFSLIRVWSASLKSSKELAKEQLAVLRWRDEQWNVLDKVSVRNLQNSLVSFEVMENYERYVLNVLNAFSHAMDCEISYLHLSFICSPPQDLPTCLSLLKSWRKVQAQGYCGPPEPSPGISMREGEQLLLRFSGNTTSTGDQDRVPHTITFHNQRRNTLYLQLEELDPFGNYSSPHYKGTAVLFRVPRHQLVWRGDRAVISEDYRRRPAGHASPPAPLGRPAGVPPCPDSLALQAFHVLAAWRWTLPSSVAKRPLLARSLGRRGEVWESRWARLRSPVSEQGAVTR